MCLLYLPACECVTQMNREREREKTEFKSCGKVREGREADKGGKGTYREKYGGV